MVDRLSPLKGKVKTRRFITFDIESKDGDSERAGFTRPFLAGVYDGKSYYHFSNLSPLEWCGSEGCIDRAMRRILTREYNGYYVYAHNAGNFDFLFLLPWLQRNREAFGIEFVIIPVCSSIQAIIVTQKRSKSSWVFLDSVKLIPMALAKALKSFGLESKVDHNLDLPTDDPRWFAYLKRDCVSLHELLSKFHDYVENVLMGEVAMTAPGTAMKIFRRRFLKKPIERNVETHQFVRSGYFGGRVEAFCRELTEMSYYDFNSSYPASMLEPVPVGTATWWQGEVPERLMHGRVGFVECDIDVPPMRIAPLPVHVRRGCGPGLPEGKLIFPTGHLRGVWAWSELEMALSRGCTIVRWGRSVWYPAEPIFREYVEVLYRYRDKSLPGYDPTLSDLAKLFLNSTSGKFGMKTLRRKYYHRDDPDLVFPARPANGNLDCEIWISETESDAAYIIPQIAATITASARVRLCKTMWDAEDRGGLVAYCDTDSICGRVSFESSTSLGKLKDEYPDYNGRLEGLFIGPKMYALWCDGWKSIKAKGVTPSARFKDAERKAELSRMFDTLASGGTVEVDRLEKIGALARRAFATGPQMVKVPRAMRSTIGKRSGSGNDSMPHHMRMW
jgi:DNA polymerase elongation subunit (family B)